MHSDSTRQKQDLFSESDRVSCTIQTGYSGDTHHYKVGDMDNKRCKSKVSCYIAQYPVFLGPLKALDTLLP